MLLNAFPSLQDDPNATLDTVIWASPNSILVCLDSGPEADQAPMAMITWPLQWDASTAGTSPEGLVVQSADFCDVQHFTSGRQTPHMKAVFVPGWNLLLAVHQNSHNYHLKVLGEAQHSPDLGSCSTGNSRRSQWGGGWGWGLRKGQGKAHLCC